MTLEQTIFEEIGSSFSEVKRSNLFGKPCFMVNGKPFIAFFQDAMIFKVNAEKVSDVLGLENAQLFDPNGKGKPMKQWVQVPYHSQNEWKKLSEEAFLYMEEVTKTV